MLYFLFYLLVLAAPLSHANDMAEPLQPDEAFVLTASAKTPEQLELSWDIAEGHYLYRHKFAVISQTPSLNVQPLHIPVGEKKQDNSFGEVEIYRQHLTIEVPLQRQNAMLNNASVEVIYQGCADNSVCYLPVHKTLTIDLP